MNGNVVSHLVMDNVFEEYLIHMKGYDRNEINDINKSQERLGITSAIYIRELNIVNGNGDGRLIIKLKPEYEKMFNAQKKITAAIEKIKEDRINSISLEESLKKLADERDEGIELAHNLCESSGLDDVFYKTKPLLAINPIEEAEPAIA